MIRGVIYCYISPSGKKYVGQTIHEEKRKDAHRDQAMKRESNYAFHRAIRKYGYNNFEYRVLDLVVVEDKTICLSLLRCLEGFWITKLKTIGIGGYNMIKAKESNLGGIAKGVLWRQTLYSLNISNRMGKLIKRIRAIAKEITTKNYKSRASIAKGVGVSGTEVNRIMNHTIFSKFFTLDEFGNFKKNYNVAFELKDIEVLFKNIDEFKISKKE